MFDDKMKAIWRALVERRSRRNIWVYFVSGICTFLLVMWCLGDLGAPLPYAAWLLLPVAVFTIQALRPTLLGWLLITLPWVSYTVLGYYYSIERVMMYRSRGEPLGGEMIGGFITDGIFTTLCILLLVYYPRRDIVEPSDGANAALGAPRSSS
jgi:hypothetical protein